MRVAIGPVNSVNGSPGGQSNGCLTRASRLSSTTAQGESASLLSRVSLPLGEPDWLLDCVAGSAQCGGSGGRWTDRPAFGPPTYLKVIICIAHFAGELESGANDPCSAQGPFRGERRRNLTFAMQRSQLVGLKWLSRSGWRSPCCAWQQVSFQASPGRITLVLVLNGHGRDTASVEPRYAACRCAAPPCASNRLVAGPRLWTPPRATAYRCISKR